MAELKRDVEEAERTMAQTIEDFVPVVRPTAKIERETAETKVYAALRVDGVGYFEVQDRKGDEAFLKHMCETLGRYAGWNLDLEFEGDMPHHVIEDVAITLGEAFRAGLGDKPVQRMASATAVMDDAMVTVAVDLADRPYADVDCPKPLYRHFLRSFAMSARICLHAVVVRGEDEHHVTEAEMKALGMALKEAARQVPLPISTTFRPEPSDEEMEDLFRWHWRGA